MKRSKLFWIISVFTLSYTSFISSTKAQIVPDTTLFTNSSTTTDGNTTVITGGTQAGASLFHSFEQFSVTTGGTAYFNNALEVQNIFSRVTGRNTSNIDGSIRANGAANLFLLNPNGIVFGANAKLDIGGSFLGSTANSINFTDGSQFSVTAPQATPLLTVSVPIGLGFGSNPGGISVQGNGSSAITPLYSPVILSSNTSGLKLQPNKTLALIGGNLNLEGSTLTVGTAGHIELGSVNSGQVYIVPSMFGWTFDYKDIHSFQDIRVSQKALVDATDHGAVGIQGRNVSLHDGSLILAGAVGSQLFGGIKINASESLEVSGKSSDGSTISTIATGTLGQERAGNIEISTKNLIVQNGGRIITATHGSAPAGNLVLDASESIQLLGFLPDVNGGISYIGNITYGVADAGSIKVNTKRLTATDGANLASSTFGSGKASDININVSEHIELSGITPNSFTPAALASTTLSSGSSGNLSINTSNIVLRNGGSIGTSTFANGDAGNVSIYASKAVDISGKFSAPQVPIPSGVSSSAIIGNQVFQQQYKLPPAPTGRAGNLTINTPQIRIIDGGAIFVSNVGNSRGGTLQLNTNSIFLDNGGISAATTSEEGGNIFLRSHSFQLRNGSNITATAGGTGNGGNITINTDTLAALNNSDISADAIRGRGGNIQIATQGLFRSSDSNITASSQFGANGVVDIRNLGFEVENAITPFATNFISTEQVLANSCLAQRNKQQGRFVVTGSGALPLSPFSDMNEFPYLTGVQVKRQGGKKTQQRSHSNAPTSSPAPVWKEGDPVVEAQAIVKTADGRTLLGMSPGSVEPKPVSQLVCQGN